VFTQVLAQASLSTLEHYLYIGLYVFFFMLDDLIIFGLAAFAVSSGIGERYAKYCKVLGGVILFALGLLLLFAPHLLR
jgi:cadmium resistance protein CadD (predicted permease)